MARFTAAPDLDARLAATIGRRAVDRLAGRLRDVADHNAPPVKVWVTAHDERVRPSHVEADGQTIPDNLRYQLHRMIYERKGRDEHGKAINPAGGWKTVHGTAELAVEPRDPNLSIEQRINCRCVSVPVPGVIGRTIHKDPTEVTGTRVRAEVATRFPRAAESEFPQAPDGGGGWMRRAVDQVAGESRASARRA